MATTWWWPMVSTRWVIALGDHLRMAVATRNPLPIILFLPTHFNNPFSPLNAVQALPDSFTQPLGPHRRCAIRFCHRGRFDCTQEGPRICWAPCGFAIRDLPLVCSLFGVPASEWLKMGEWCEWMHGSTDQSEERIGGIKKTYPRVFSFSAIICTIVEACNSTEVTFGTKSHKI